MKYALRSALAVARMGLAFGLFYLVTTTLGGILLRGELPHWRTELFNVLLWPVPFGVGGLIYGLMLPAFARGRAQPSTARLLAGTAVGALTGVLITFPFLLRETQLEMIWHAAVVLGVAAIGALLGALGGLMAARRARGELRLSST